MRPFLNITKALADESRARVLLALRGGELCLCQICDLLGLAPSTVSKHMTILVQADLALCRKDGRWHYYRLPGAAEASALIRTTLEWLAAAAGRCPTAARDRKRLQAICKREKEDVSACCYRS